MNELYHNSTTCNKNRRCRLFKKCHTCAKIRQARLADVAQLAARFSPSAQYAVVMPHAVSQQQLKSLKTKIQRKLKPITDGTFTSVESSQNDALHLNILLTSSQPVTTDPLEKVLKNEQLEANIFIDSIKTSDEIRRVAAYACKFQNIPTKEQYNGNLISSTGTMRTCREIMQSMKMIKAAPMVALVSFNNTMAEIGCKPIDDWIYRTNFMQSNAALLLGYAEQAKKMGMYYSPHYGLQTAEQLQKRFSKQIAQIKRKETLAKKRAAKTEYYANLASWHDRFSG